MIFRQFLHEERSCASYLIGCPRRGVAAVIDPQGDHSLYTTEAGKHGLAITDVLETHVHADHPSAALGLSNDLDATLWLGEGADVGFRFDPLIDGAVIDIGSRHIRVIHTPGHTPEHVCLLVDEWFLLTGDTLFVGDVGRVDLALSDLNDVEVRTRAEVLHASLQKLSSLPDETEIYPGHYSGSTCGRGMDGKTISTIGRERRTNRAFSLELEEFVRYQISDLPPVPEDFDRLKRANLSGRAKEVVAGVTQP